MVKPSTSRQLSEPDWRALAKMALDEDCASDDATTALLGDRGKKPAVGGFRAEGEFIVAGLPLVEAVFRGLDPSVSVDILVEEGGRTQQGALIANVNGPAGVLLGGERVALNFLQRLSGIATVTRRAMDLLAGTQSVVTDTRKTTPGLREAEKYAVRTGGGTNHRQSLADQVLWKDNHWAMLEGAPTLLGDVLAKAPPGMPVCVEVETDEQLEVALKAGASWLLIDNQSPEKLALWSRRIGNSAIIEASGGILPEDVRAYADAGADRISLGALTYSPDPVSISFEIVA